MSNPAPGELELVRSFVNTWDVDEGTDAIESPEGLGAWLAENGLLDKGAKVTPADQRRAAGVREALRATLRAPHGATRRSAPTTSSARPPNGPSSRCSSTATAPRGSS